MSYDCENLCVPVVESILLSSHYCNRAEGTNFAGAAGAESRPNWYTGTSEQTKMYVFVGVLAGTVGAADNTLWRILSGASGAANTWISYWVCALVHLSECVFIFLRGTWVKALCGQTEQRPPNKELKFEISH